MSDPSPSNSAAEQGILADDIGRMCMANLLRSPAERVYFKDRMSRFLFVSEGWRSAEAADRTLEQIVGMTDADFFSPEHASAALADEREILATGLPIIGKVERETFVDAPDAWVMTTKMPLRSFEGEIVGTFGISRDVTAEHAVRARQAALAKVGEHLAAAESRSQMFQALLDGALGLISNKGVRGAVIGAGRESPQVLASSLDPVRNPLLIEITLEAVHDCDSQETVRAVRQQGLAALPLRGVHQTLGAIVFESDHDLTDADLEDVLWLATTVAIILDNLITARRLRALVNHACDAFLVVTPDGIVRYHASSADRLLGYTPAETVGRSLADFVHNDDFYPLSQAIALPVSPDGVTIAVRWLRADGAWRSTEVTIADLREESEIEGVALTIRDITERERLEIELRHAHKLEAIGQLAGGVAHEINTPIQFILDNLQFLNEAFAGLIGVIDSQRSMLASPTKDWAAQSRQLERAADLAYMRTEIPAAINQSVEGSRRVAKIVAALKSFGYPDRGRMIATDINESLQNAITVARSEIKYVANVVEEYGDIPMALVVPGDIGQVFLNLVINAAHAITERLGSGGELGKITVRTRVQNGAVVVSITDDGAGIPAEIADRIFEPFFTTKEVGKGTGQGLALARSVLDNHKGSISFSSHVGLGSTFVVRIPCDAPNPADKVSSAAAEGVR